MAIMQRKAQASLEYLMTYGWALVLIAAVVGVLVFIVSSPASDVRFSSSDPTKILIKAGTSDGSTAEVQMQNITGGGIEVGIISSAEFSNCTINGASVGEGFPPISLTSGIQMTLECDAPSDNTGTITIDYRDYAGLIRTVEITIIGQETGGGGAPGPPQIFEYYNTTDTGLMELSGDYWEAQTFTPSQAHTVTSVKLKIARFGYPGQVVVGIRATDGSGHPTGADLCSATTDGDTLVEDFVGEWREITMSSGCNLLASTKYAIIVRAPNGGGFDLLLWANHTSNPYAGGNAERSDDAGGSWSTEGSWDWLFEEWGIAS